MLNESCRKCIDDMLEDAAALRRSEKYSANWSAVHIPDPVRDILICPVCFDYWEMLDQQLRNELNGNWVLPEY